MKKLILYINGIMADVERLDFVFESLIHERQLINNAIDQMKLRNRVLLANQDWELFISCESKMNSIE